MLTDQALINLFIVTLAFTGFILIAVFLWILMTIKGGENIKYGGVVIIGPIPIAFGTDKEPVSAS